MTVNSNYNVVITASLTVLIGSLRSVKPMPPTVSLTEAASLAERKDSENGRKMVVNAFSRQLSSRTQTFLHHIGSLCGTPMSMFVGLCLEKVDSEPQVLILGAP